MTRKEKVFTALLLFISITTFIVLYLFHREWLYTYYTERAIGGIIGMVLTVLIWGAWRILRR